MEIYKELEGKEHLWGPFTTPIMLMAGIWGGINPENKTIVELESQLSGTDKKNALLSFSQEWALGELKLARGEASPALEQFTRSLQSLNWWADYGFLVDRFIAICLEEEAPEQLIQGLQFCVQATEQLHDLHPSRAHMRIRLAEALLQNEGKASEIRELLVEARKIYEKHGDLIASEEQTRLNDMLASITAE